MSVFKEKDLDSTVVMNKGTDVFNQLLLDQYRNSPNLKEYSGAYLAEFDTLFEQVERVYLGRFLEYATGKQLAILGDIVGVSRELSIDASNFGFMYDVTSGTFGTIGDTDIGEPWGSLNPVIVTLDDSTFRKAVRAKALCNGAKFQDVDFMYDVIAILLGQVPSVFMLQHDESIQDADQFGFEYSTGSGTLGTVGDSGLGGVFESLSPSFIYIAEFNNKIILTLDNNVTSTQSISLINSMKPYFVPSGYKFEFNLI
jgi:hypothetical protein